MDVLFAKERGSKIGRGYAGVRLEEFDLRFFLDVVNANECARRRNTRITEVGWKRQQFVVEPKIVWISIWFFIVNFWFSFLSNDMSSKRMTVQLGCCLQGHTFVLSGF